MIFDNFIPKDAIFSLQCQLINGCEILIVTPPSLKRVMDAGYTDLQRLCHLVSYEKMSLITIYRDFLAVKIEDFDRKILIFFSAFAQNIDFGYMLERPR